MPYTAPRTSDMTEAAQAPPPKRGSAKRALHPFPLFDTPALLQLLTEHNIKHTWATLLHTTLLHSTPTFTHPPTPITPPAADLLVSVLASLPPSSLSPPASLLPLLTEHTTVLSSTIAKHQTSGDGTTTKLLVRLADGELVESVIMRHRAKQLPYTQLEEAEEGREAEEEQKEEKVDRLVTVKRAGRITLCVSSQIGCKQGCTFCATGTLGLRGHLMSGEIVEQLVHANRLLAAEATATTDASNDTPRVTNIVYMGQGEPLDNYAAVLSSIALFTSARLFRLSPSRITVSTVGLAHRIQSLAIDAPHVQLALSLHAPTQELRLTLVPSAAAYTIDWLMSALSDYIDRTPRGKRVLIEYVLLHSINDQPHHATQLVHLLTPLRAHLLLNLIPWNPTAVTAAYRAPEREAVLAFQRVMQAGGVWCSVRQEMGQDVDGACGQLALKSRQASAARATGSSGGGDVRDIEDMVRDTGSGEKKVRGVVRRQVNCKGRRAAR